MELEKTTRIEHFYSKNYKKLLIIPLILIILTITILSVNYASKGTIIERDVSLIGGVSATVYTDKVISLDSIESSLSNEFPSSDVSVRKLADLSTGRNLGYIIEATNLKSDEFETPLSTILGLKLTEENLSIEEIGSSLGASFFKEMIYALIFAFVLMAIVVFIAFRKFVPSIAVIVSAVLDLTTTLAIISLFDVKLSSAGIAAFLMVLGYSIDTDILLTTRVLKRKIGTPISRMYGALKTGLTMTLTTLGALLVAFIFTNSQILKEMFLIIIIALIIDLISTWFMNTGLLMFYLKKKNEIN